MRKPLYRSKIIEIVKENPGISTKEVWNMFLDLPTGLYRQDGTIRAKRQRKKIPTLNQVSAILARTRGIRNVGKHSAEWIWEGAN